MTSQNSPPSTHPTDHKNTAQPKPSAQLKSRNDLLHYTAYFIGVGSLVFVAQTGEPRQIENAVIAGAIASTCVVSRDWYKARLDPSMANDPTALIGLFNEMLHAGRDQANTNAAHLKRVEFLQTDLVETMRDLNDSLRLEPAEVEQQLKAIQTAHLTSALPMINVSYPSGTDGINNVAEFATEANATHVPPSTTVRQSYNARCPGFDA
jgi:hypothetical protein